MPRRLVRSAASVSGSRVQWTEAKARSVLAALDASGLSVMQFAAREGLNDKRLYHWRARFRMAAMKKPTFVEIKPAASSPIIEVVLDSGHLVRVPNGFDGVTLRRLVDALERDAGC